MNINTPEVRALVARAFPEYNGKHYKVEPFQGPMRLDSYWSGGSRDYWCAVRFTDGATSTVPENGTPFTPEIGELKELPANTALVLHHCGPYSYCTVYVNPDNLNRLALPAPVELTREEQIVLTATSGLKSSYAGIKNYRFHEANQTTGITLAQWEQAKASCQSRGLLNKAGAITDAGRNAVSNARLDNFRNPPVLCQS